MMIFWIVAALLTAGVVAIGLWPLGRRPDGEDAVKQAVAFYEESKAELARQRDAGEITAEEFSAAEAEQARNLIARTRVLKGGGAGDPARIARRRKAAALLGLLALPTLPLLVYLRLGSPNAPDVPLASREISKDGRDLASALQKIEAHLNRNPNDGKGYEVVAPVYFRAGRYADAVRAYSRVVDLLGPSPERWADLGEAHMALANGIVTAEAREAFEKAVAIEPNFAKARYYIAFSKEQEGNVAGALADLKALEAALPDGPPKARVQAEIARLGGATASPETSEAGRAIANLPKDEQQAAIRSMVDGLEARILSEGGKLEDWVRLLRARAVIGDGEKVKTLIQEARNRFAQDSAALSTLADLERALAEAPKP